MMSIENILVVFLIMAVAATSGAPTNKSDAAGSSDHGPCRGFLGQANNFELAFYQKLLQGSVEGDESTKASKKNLIASPFSLSTLLGMVTLGAGGTTRQELDELLLGKQGVPDEILLDGYGDLNQRAVVANQKVLASANMMYPAADFTVRNQYRDMLMDHFHAQIRSVNFTDPATRSQINGDVSNATRGLIPTLFEEDFDSATRMVLVNALYFKGQWTKEFNKNQTREMDFFDEDGTTAVGKVQMMYRKDKKMLYAQNEDLGLEAVMLPYNESNTAMVVILPNRGVSLTDLQMRLTAQAWKDLLGSFREGNVRLFLPRFKTESTHPTLADVIRRMGATELFGTQANFTGISETGESLFVTQVIQKATIEVNEEGTVAAAATGATFELTSFPGNQVIFKADRPFMYGIVSEVAASEEAKEGEEGEEAEDAKPAGFVSLFMGQFIQP